MSSLQSHETQYVALTAPYGGAGCSLLVRHLAGLGLSAGLRVTIVDLSPVPSTLEQWLHARRRRQMYLQPLVPVWSKDALSPQADPVEARAIWTDLRTQLVECADWVLVDAGTQNTPMAGQALASASIWAMPTTFSASQYALLAAVMKGEHPFSDTLQISRKTAGRFGRDHDFACVPTGVVSRQHADKVDWDVLRRRLGMRFSASLPFQDILNTGWMDGSTVFDGDGSDAQQGEACSALRMLALSLRLRGLGAHTAAA